MRSDRKKGAGKERRGKETYYSEGEKSVRETVESREKRKRRITNVAPKKLTEKKDRKSSGR